MTSNRTVGGKPFPYKYKHNTFKRAPTGGGVYAKVRGWLDANFTRHNGAAVAHWFADDKTLVATGWMSGLSGTMIRVTYDAETET